ncbi:MAG: phosphoribosyltransferase family protein [Candidatus Babeliales bacterium]
MLIQRIYKTILHLLFPPFCPFCRAFVATEEVIFCVHCAAKVEPIVSELVRIRESVHMPVFAVGNYQEPLRCLIMAKHWNNSLAATQMAQLMSRMPVMQLLEFDYIVPIPLHWTRYAWRGFNQSILIAQQLSALSGRPVVHAVKRKKRTALQATLNLEKRGTNVADAFELSVDAAMVQGKRILIVDDLMTTGATLRAVAKVIYRAKPAQLYGAVLCRVI